MIEDGIDTVFGDEEGVLCHFQNVFLFQLPEESRDMFPAEIEDTGNGFMGEIIDKEECIPGFMSPFFCLIDQEEQERISGCCPFVPCDMEFDHSGHVLQDCGIDLRKRKDMIQKVLPADPEETAFLSGYCRGVVGVEEDLSNGKHFSRAQSADGLRSVLIQFYGEFHLPFENEIEIFSGALLPIDLLSRPEGYGAEVSQKGFQDRRFHGLEQFQLLQGSLIHMSHCIPVRLSGQPNNPESPFCFTAQSYFLVIAVTSVSGGYPYTQGMYWKRGGSA